MRDFKSLWIFCFSLLFLTSCLQIGINFKHKTPSKGSQLPVFARKDSLLGFPYQRRQCFDVTHYAVELSLNPKEKSISGQVTTSFKMIEPANTLQLDLDKRLTIDSICQDGRLLIYSREQSAVLITLMNQKNSQRLTIYYHGQPKSARRPPWEGGMVWKKDRDGKPWAGVACEGDGAHLWLPVKLLLADEPDSADLIFKVPHGLVAIANGTLVEKQSSPTIDSYHWKTSYPINVYNLTFYLGQFHLQERPYQSISGRKIPQQFWILPEHAELAPSIFKYSDSVLNCYERIFGEYPWQREAYKLVESPYEGMEHQTAIAYGSGFKTHQNSKFNYIVVHETAHEWWGNSVSVADFSEVWIHEGFATYSEALYVEAMWGHTAYLRYMQNIHYSILNKKPVIGPSGVYYWDYRDGDVYMKGAAFLHALRCKFQNDELFFELLKKFYAQHKYQVASTAQFLELASELYGQDLTVFFDHYLYQRAAPRLVWNVTGDKDGMSQKLQFRFENTVDGFQIPIKIKAGDRDLLFNTGNKLQSLRITESEKENLQINSEKIYLQIVHKKSGKIE